MDKANAVAGENTARTLLRCTSKNASKIALAAALVPLGSVATPAEAVTTVMTSAETKVDGGTTDNDTDQTTSLFTSASANDFDVGIEARARGSLDGNVFVRSEVFGFSGDGSGGIGVISITPTQDELQREANANTTWMTELSEGNHRFIFHVTNQFLSAMSDNADGSSAMTEMKVTVGEGPNEQVLYHWAADLLTTMDGDTFTFNEIANPQGVNVPTYNEFTNIVTAPAFDVGLDLGFQPAGTKLKAEFSSSAFSDGEIENNKAGARFGDPFGPDDPFDFDFEVITTQVGGAVPEPMTAMLAFGALGTLAMSRRQRN